MINLRHQRSDWFLVDKYIERIEAAMLNTLWAVVREGKVEFLEEVDVPEGTKVLVTLLPDDKDDFWLTVSQVSLDKIWDNAEDDVYEKLLEG
jgi:hypothetical protein